MREVALKFLVILARYSAYYVCFRVLRVLYCLYWSTVVVMKSVYRRCIRQYRYDTYV